MRSGRATLIALGLGAAMAASSFADTFEIPKDVLRDKIRGGWAGKVIGCTYGGPTEFRFQGTFIQDYQPIAWSDGAIAWYFKNAPGLYDDIYMNLTFVDVLRKEGLDASARSLARAFANAPYPLWHANQMARVNIKRGLEPPASGDWRNNPHADDIDFEIEADFAGLMSPGLVEAAVEFADRTGHIMNSGDGWYGGVYIAAMYALAFVSDDVGSIVREALKTIPEGSRFREVMNDVIRWHFENPNDWHETWFRVQRKWSEDIGCPEGVFSPFDIDAKINAAWVLVGLLYGGGDFGKTIDIAARCGDDSDCNPSTAAGILGTVLGYNRIPERWRGGLRAVEQARFPYMEFSLLDACGYSFDQALAVVARSGGRVTGDGVQIVTNGIRPVRLEVNFPGLRPTEKRELDVKPVRQTAIEFEGVGIVLCGQAMKTGGAEALLEAEVAVDGGAPETFELPTDQRWRRDPIYWTYSLKPGRHSLAVKVLGPAERAELRLSSAVIYGREPK